jgi:hypothetical protein
MRNFRGWATASTILLSVWVGASGCDGDSVGQEVGTASILRSHLVGVYETTVFLAVVEGDTLMLLDAGAELTMNLRDDGSTTGRLLISDVGEDGGDLDEDLSGTWTFFSETNTVEFDQVADTFVRDMTFSAVHEDGRLTLLGKEDFNGDLIEVALRQSE